MARIGAHEHLKAEVIALIQRGSTPTEIMKAYPQLPRRTVYNWHLLAQEKVLEERYQKLNDPATITMLEGYAEKSDIGLARHTLRSISKDRSASPSVRVQAALGLMRLAYLRSELPKHIIEETSTIDIDTHKREASEMDEAELQRRIREKMA